MDRLLERQGGKCHWCRCKIVRVGSIDREKISILSDHFVVWRREDGRKTQALVATIDHVIPSSRGGTNGLDNLVAACRWCNEERGNKTPVEILDLSTRPPESVSVAPATPTPPTPVTAGTDWARAVFW